MKKNKEVLKRHHIIVSILKPFVSIVIKLKYNVKYKKNREFKHKGPFLVLGNHTVPVDPILMGLNFPFHLYYFATEQIFNLGLISKIMIYAFNPIKKSKSVSDISAIRKAKQIVNEGGSIGIFPEGNVSYNGETQSINGSIIKLVRLLKIPVVILKSRGLYLSNPRWSINRKKGKTESYIDRIISYEEYKDLDDLSLEKLIIESLYVNAYDDQRKEEHLYKGKDLALGLERLIFMDLNINKPFVTYSKNNLLLSHTSDFKMIYKENGLLSWNQEEYDLVTLEKMVKKSYIDYVLETNDDLLHKEVVEISKTYEKYKDELGKKEVSLCKDKIILKDNTKETYINYSEIVGMAIQGKKKVIIYVNNETLLLTLDEHSSPYKYLITYQIHQKNITRGENFNVSEFGL